MSDKTKAITTAVAVLLIGIAIGALVVGPVIARHHFRRTDRTHGREHFVAALEGRIKPSPSQAGEVEAILNKYADRLDSLRTSQRKEAEAIFDSLDTELAPVLTPEQRERLESQRRHSRTPEEPHK
jgi:hypothetical protein